MIPVPSRSPCASTSSYSPSSLCLVNPLCPDHFPLLTDTDSGLLTLTRFHHRNSVYVTIYSHSHLEHVRHISSFFLVFNESSTRPITSVTAKSNFNAFRDISHINQRVLTLRGQLFGCREAFRESSHILKEAPQLENRL